MENKQLRSAAATDKGLQEIIRPAVEVLVGRTYANAGAVEWQLQDEQDRGDHLEAAGTLQNKTHGEEVKAAWLYPKQWNGRVVVWLADSGKAALKNETRAKARARRHGGRWRRSALSKAANR